jgi:hypothetical protein
MNDFDTFDVVELQQIANRIRRFLLRHMPPDGDASAKDLLELSLCLRDQFSGS